MIVLTLEQITKNYGVKPLMDHVDLTIETGDRIGVIGVNGTGKSTFLRVCAGMEEVDSGKRITASGMRVGYLPQSPDLPRHHRLARSAPSCRPKSKRVRRV